MDTLDSLTAKINSRTEKSPIFFVTNDAERAIGLENTLINYHIICIDDNDIVSYMLEQNVKVFCLEKTLGKLNSIFRNSNRLLNHKKVQDYIRNNTPNDKGYLMFFKIAPNLERSAGKLKFNILNTPSKLNRKFELKLSQYDEIKDLDIHIPKTVILKLSDAKYSDLQRELGSHFILQFDRGHTGDGTIQINSETELDEIKNKFPDRKVRIAKYIEGSSYTLNACITQHGILWGGLSYQITGVGECTAKKLATVGNDWVYPKNLPSKCLQQIGQSTKIIGQKMAASGFKGMFGLDFVVDHDTNIPYIIEINARQPASVSMFTKMQLADKQIPLNLLAIAEFLNIDYKIDVCKYNLQASKPFEATQLFIRNKLPAKAKLISAVKPGIYRLAGDSSAYNWSSGSPSLKKNVIMLDEQDDLPFVFEKQVYSIDTKMQKKGFLILCQKEGKLINTNAEVARLQAMQSLLDKDGNLQPLILKIVKGINKYLALRQTEI